LKAELEKIIKEALKRIERAQTLQEIERIRLDLLGRKGRLTQLLRGLKDLPVAIRPEVGSAANRAKAQIEAALKGRIESLPPPQERKEALDITLPGRKSWEGSLHPLTLTLQRIIEIFYGMGFELAEGPEVETDYYNFEALNMPPDHPARDMQDTYYLGKNLLLRTQTSPVQIRVMERSKPPVRIIAPGRVYRHEAINARSFTVFYQFEGLYVDQGVTFGQLKGVLTGFIEEFFGKGIPLRFRPSFFPFTEPSAEVDIRCVICGGKGCSVCKQRGWLEILGAGMVDPAVFQAVSYDPEKFSGYAFGVGIDRIAMLKWGIDDIRLFYENDIRFLSQF